MIDMSLDEAAIIVGNLPVPTDDECYSIPEYQWAKAMAIDALYFKKDRTSAVTNYEPAMPLAPIKPEGKWIASGTITFDLSDGTNYATAYSYSCDKCGGTSLKLSKFCPECGQHMDTSMAYEANTTER